MNKLALLLIVPSLVLVGCASRPVVEQSRYPLPTQDWMTMEVRTDAQKELTEFLSILQDAMLKEPMSTVLPY